jgi:hypothetical protein
MKPVSSEQVQTLLNKIAELINENHNLRKQLKSACNALMEKKL